MLMSMGCAANGGHVGVRGPRCLRGLVDVCGLCCLWRPYGGLWSVLSPETTWKSVVHDYKEQGSFLCSGMMTADSGVRRKDVEGFYDNLSPAALT